MILRGKHSIYLGGLYGERGKCKNGDVFSSQTMKKVKLFFSHARTLVTFTYWGHQYLLIYSL